MLNHDWPCDYRSNLSQGIYANIECEQYPNSNLLGNYGSVLLCCHLWALGFP